MYSFGNIIKLSRVRRSLTRPVNLTKKKCYDVNALNIYCIACAEAEKGKGLLKGNINI